MSNIIVGGYPSGGFYTQDDIRGYKVYTALLSQTGATPPVATVLENTIGITPSFLYNGTGNYEIDFIGLSINPDKVVIFTGQSDGNSNGIVNAWCNSTPNLYITCYDLAGASIDNLLDRTSIEIRIYP